MRRWGWGCRIEALRTCLYTSRNTNTAASALALGRPGDFLRRPSSPRVPEIKGGKAFVQRGRPCTACRMDATGGCCSYSRPFRTSDRLA